MEMLLLAFGGFLPGLAMILACIYLLRRPTPLDSYLGIAICIAFGFSTIPLALLLIVPLDQFTSRIEAGSVQHGLYSAFVVAGIPEEVVRAIALFCFLRWRRDRLSSRYCLLTGAIVGLVFAAVENPFYCIDGGWSAVGERAITSVPLHALHGAIIGYAVGKALHQGHWMWIPAAIAMTSILHGVNNFSTALLYRETADGKSTIPTGGIGAILVTDWPKNIVLLMIQAGLTFLFATVGAFGSSRSLHNGPEGSEKAAG